MTDLMAALDEKLHELLGGRALRRATLLVVRTTDATCDLSLSVDTEGEPGKPFPPGGLASFPAVDRTDVQAALTWARTHGAGDARWSRRVHLGRWAPWQTLSVLDRARELLRFFPEASPLRVEMSRGRPASERGEEPMGQPNLQLYLRDPEGRTTSEYLDLRYTSPFDHPAVEAEVLASARALADALDVPCDILGEPAHPPEPPR